MRISTALSTIAVSLLMSTTIASSHAIWLAERHGEATIVYGHGSTDEAYDPAKLKSISGTKLDGSPAQISLKPASDHVMLEIPEDTAIISGEFDNGFWSEGADGKWVNEPKNKVPNAKSAGHYIKYLTALLKPTGKAPVAKGLALEVLPLTDPLSLKAGDDLIIQVLANGKPVAGAEITAEYTTASEAEKLKTDADGKATIKIRNQGLNVILANHTQVSPDLTMADEIGLTAALSFALAHGEE